jgi:motility quorum-sensing regulator / GCU-specific mRNA interferase toxin
MKKKAASYDLEELKELLKKEESRIVMQRDRREAVKLGYADDEEMVVRVLKLRPEEFYKTMPSERFSNLMQDVYYTQDKMRKLYIKLQISFNGKGIIISFKEA